MMGAWLPSGDCCYGAPECFKNDAGMKACVFSFGFILYEIVTGKPLFPTDLGMPVTVLLVDHFRPDFKVVSAVNAAQLAPFVEKVKRRTRRTTLPDERFYSLH
jgi:hypothetical protein